MLLTVGTTEAVEAIAEARRRAMGDLRLVEWIRREIPSWMRTAST